MKTLVRLLLVLTLTVSAGACTSTILGPDNAEAGATTRTPGPGMRAHSPGPGAHNPDPGA